MQLKHHNRLPLLIAGSYLVVVTLILVVLRIQLTTDIANSDETIAIGVSHSMMALGRLDPNWALAPMTYDFFKYPQYNFYSYNIFSHFVLLSLQWSTLDEIVSLRLANIVYQTIGIVSIILALRNLRLPPWTYLVTATLFVVSPSLVHDAQMARTESFLFMIFCLTALMASSDNVKLSKLVLGGLLVGVGAASKITFILVAIIFVGTIGSNSREVLVRVGIIIISIGLGFAISAPYAVLNFDVFIEGMNILSNQYTGTHGPHSFLAPSPVRSLLLQTTFLLYVYGTVVPAAILMPIVIPQLRRGLSLGLWIFTVVTIVYFGTRPVFFERNLALAVAAAIVIYTIMLAHMRSLFLRATLVVLAVVPMSFWSFHIALTSHGLEGHTQFERSNGLQVATFYSGNSLIIAPCSGVFGSHDYNDEVTQRVREAIEAAGYEKVARYNSHFYWLPTSTLHTYLDPSFNYYKCKSEETKVVVE